MTVGPIGIQRQSLLLLGVVFTALEIASSALSDRGQGFSDGSPSVPSATPAPAHPALTQEDGWWKCGAGRREPHSQSRRPLDDTFKFGFPLAVSTLRISW